MAHLNTKTQAKHMLIYVDDLKRSRASSYYVQNSLALNTSFVTRIHTSSKFVSQKQSVVQQLSEAEAKIQEVNFCMLLLTT